MVWGTITFYGAIDLIFIDQNKNAERFKIMLESVFPLLKGLFGAILWIFFQQVNSPDLNA